MPKGISATKHKSTYVQQNDKKYGFIQITFLIVISVILFFPPFVRGLFFEKEQFVVEAFTFGVFILYWIYKFIKKDRKFIKTPVELAAFGLFLIYLVSIVYAISTRDALSEWLKYCMYFSVFFILSELLNTFKLRRAFLWVIAGVTVLLCLVGIDGAAGSTVTNWINALFKAMGSEGNLFFDIFKGNRIYSSLQYPNALASYVFACFIIVTGLGVTYESKWFKAVSGAISGLFFLTFILTFSRGAYLLVPLAVIVLFVVLPRGGRVRIFSFGLLPVLVSIPFSLAISKVMGEKTEEGMMVWLLTFGCIIISGLAGYAYSYLVVWFEKISWKTYALVFAGLAVLGGICIAIILNADTPLVLQHSANEADSGKYLQKSIILKPGKDYTLKFDVDASSSADKPYTYYISINSKNLKDILSSGQEQLAVLSDKKTAGVMNKSIDFTVPADNKEVDITFTNYYQGTNVTFNNAVIIDKASNKIVKRLKFNYKFIPASFAQRFENLGTDASNIQRQIYYKDAAKIIKDRWLLGGGGKAWEKLYYQYQSFGYSSTQAHNYFLQVAVETGDLGIIILILLIASIIYIYIKSYQQGNFNDKILQAVLLTAIISMLAHAAMDFDLSLSAVFLLLWQLLAVYNSSYRQNTDIASPAQKLKLPMELLNRIYNIRLSPIIAVIVLCAIIYFPIAYKSALSDAETYTRYAKIKDTDTAMKHMKQATQLDPLNSDYSIKYLSLLLGKKNVTNDEMSRIAALSEKVEKASSHDANLATNYAVTLLSTGNINKGMDYLDLGIKLRPHYLVQWKTKIDACYQIAMMRLSVGDTKNALAFANKGLAVIDEARAANKLSLVPFSPDEATMADLEKLSFIINNTKSDKRVDVNTILFYNISSMDINTDLVPDQWTADNPAKTKLVVRKGQMEIDGEKGFIQSRQLTLAPAKSYQIEVKVKDTPDTGGLAYRVIGIMSKNEVLQYKDGRYYAVIKPGDKSATGALRIELPKGCVVEEVLMKEV